jgi:DUF917 family protein
MRELTAADVEALAVGAWILGTWAEAAPIPASLMCGGFIKRAIASY